MLARVLVTLKCRAVLLPVVLQPMTPTFLSLLF